MNRPSSNSDSELINQIRSENTGAFETLIEDYKKLVSHIIFRMVSNISDREDICQDVFVKIYQNIGGFRFDSKLSTWIATIAHNTCINYLQKKKIPLFADQTPEGLTLENQSSDEILPDTFVMENDISVQIKSEIEKLDIPYRTILTLYHLDEMSYAEISEIMNLPQGTVKSYLFRARKQLRKNLIISFQKEEIWDSNI